MMKKTLIVMMLIFSFFTGVVRAQDIYTAAYRGDLETVKKWLQQDAGLVHALNANGRFALEMAAQTGQIDVVTFLLAHGADVNMNRNGVTALHMAALYGGKTELIRLLLDKGADLNARTGNGQTPLNLAVVGRQKAIAELLLDRGGEISLEGRNLNELLYVSASTGIERVVDMVVNKEIDFFFAAANGDTMLHGAAEGGMEQLAGTLLTRGVSVNTVNIYGQTPLHIAARSGHPRLVELLLDRGAEIDARTKNGKNPLHFAREHEHDSIVAYLRKKGADASEWTFPKFRGKYLDQSPPGQDPVIFAPGVISAQEHFEHSCLAFAPDYSEVYWSSDFTEFGFYDIVCMKKNPSGWSQPELASFSKQYHAGSPVFSSDGKRLYFSSRRPRKEGEKSGDTNIWFVEKAATGWGVPECLPEIINSDQSESVLSISGQGTLVFRRGMEMFRSERRNGVFHAPEKVNLKLDSGARIFHVFVAGDERYLIMESFGGTGGHGGGDLYACYRLKDGSWSEPVNLGPGINTAASERFPCVTPDGKYLIFLRVGDGSDFYWVSADVIETLKPKRI